MLLEAVLSDAEAFQRIAKLVESVSNDLIPECEEILTEKLGSGRISFSFALTCEGVEVRVDLNSFSSESLTLHQRLKSLEVMQEHSFSVFIRVFQVCK